MALPMIDRGPRRAKIERQLVGELTVGDRTIQPIARVRGWYGCSGSEAGGGTGAWLRVIPVEVVVRESNGNEYTVAITDPTREAIRGLISSAIMVAAVFWLLMLILRLKRT